MWPIVQGKWSLTSWRHSLTQTRQVGSPSDKRSTTEYCIFLGGNLVRWKSKKQTFGARSSVEVDETSIRGVVY